MSPRGFPMLSRPKLPTSEYSSFNTRYQATRVWRAGPSLVDTPGVVLVVCARMRIWHFLELSVSLLMPCLASAERSPAALLLEGDLAAHAPAAWQVHVSERPEGLVAFIILPYQEGFDLWYQPSLLKARMQALCPKTADPVWAELDHGHAVFLEPTVGGKTVDTMRIPCAPGVGRPS